MSETIQPIITEAIVNEKRYLRPREVAQQVGLSESEVYRSIYSGKLRAMRYKSRSWLVARDAVDAWIESQSEPNTA